MARLIDADAIDKRYVPIAPVIEGDAVHYEWVAFVEDINEQPTIDAVPLRIGRWEPYCLNLYKESLNVIRCSECHKVAIDRYPFCPNCGAKMENAREDERD